MDFLRIAGNETILNDWIDYLVECNLIQVVEVESKKYHMETNAGQKLHEVLKLHPYFGPLFEDLSRNLRHKSAIFRS